MKSISEAGAKCSSNEDDVLYGSQRFPFLDLSEMEILNSWPIEEAYLNTSKSPILNLRCFLLFLNGSLSSSSNFFFDISTRHFTLCLTSHEANSFPIIFFLLSCSPCWLKTDDSRQQSSQALWQEARSQRH